jgi:hypothetical protein
MRINKHAQPPATAAGVASSADETNTQTKRPKTADPILSETDVGRSGRSLTAARRTSSQNPKPSFPRTQARRAGPLRPATPPASPRPCSPSPHTNPNAHCCLARRSPRGASHADRCAGRRAHRLSRHGTARGVRRAGKQHRRRGRFASAAAKRAVQLGGGRGGVRRKRLLWSAFLRVLIHR